MDMIVNVNYIVIALRAKMNQQRSRRFRASKETQEKIDTMDRIRHSSIQD